MQDQNTALIIDTIKALRTDFDNRFTQLDDKMSQIGRDNSDHAVQIGVLSEKYNTLERNNTKIWETIDTFRTEQAVLKKDLEVHATSTTAADNAAEKVTDRGFSWANLLTPAVLTIGLFVLGYLIQAGGTK